MKYVLSLAAGYAVGYWAVNKGLPILLSKIAMVGFDEDYEYLCYWELDEE